MLLVDINYNFEFDWFVELSGNKLSDNNLASELVGNIFFFKPITIEEIVIFMINVEKKAYWPAVTPGHYRKKKHRQQKLLLEIDAG